MTSSPDDSRDDSRKGPPDGQAQPDVPFDEDEAWQAIVANYGERATLADGGAATAPEPTRSEPNIFDRGYLDSLRPQPPLDPGTPEPGSWADEGHFVPPEPPPLPGTTPARRIAWFGLFGAPLLMLLAVIGHWTYPTWFAMFLVGAFVGGFVFLVATMEQRGGDGWGGDDGAVV
jgi:hypothetical protein